MVTPVPAAVSTHHGDTEQGGTRAEAIPLVYYFSLVTNKTIQRNY